jgi:hypothetical protein
MFWNKQNPEGPGSLEKGRVDTDRSSLTSTQSSIVQPPKFHVKGHPTPPLYSPAQLASVSSDTRYQGSYPSNGTRRGPSRPPSFLRRHWFAIFVAVFVTMAIIVAVTVVLVQRTGRDVLSPVQLAGPSDFAQPDTVTTDPITSL